MQVEVLKFLLEAQQHLFDEREASAAAADHEDLQAVERALPDCDWFEIEEVRAGRVGDGPPWDERAVHLDF